MNSSDPIADTPLALQEGARRPRVLLVGIDGATLRIIDPLIREGRLPVLAGLAREGASGPLRSHQPIYSPRIWNSIATGMTAEQQHKIFDPFVQADTSTSKNYGGTGLGLAICKEDCDLMGGTITVDSKEGVGTRFDVILPFRVPVPESDHAAA